MKCEALRQSNLNLVKVTQNKKPYTVMKENGEFTDISPSGSTTLDKKVKGYCTCEGHKLKNFECYKINTKKDHGSDTKPHKETGSLYRVTPICFCVHKLDRKSQLAK